MKQYLQPICEMVSFDPHEDILTTSPTSFTRADDNSVNIDSITW